MSYDRLQSWGNLMSVNLDDLKEMDLEASQGLPRSEKTR